VVTAFVIQLSLVPNGQSAKLQRGRLIQNLSISARSINPASGEATTLHVTLSRAAYLEAEVVDRDGFVIRSLAPKSGAAGDNVFVWDGRDDRAEVVADEAYSFRLQADYGADEYFPAARDGAMVAVNPLSYSHATATLSYRLTVPSRVHVQAGTVRTDNGSRSDEGPVLKTIVDRQPRAAGVIAEHWSGFDESGSLYIPDLQGFVVAIAATPLPENSVITFGNAKRSFLDYAAHRTGHSRFPHRSQAAHHAGLDVFNDVAPRLSVTPVDRGRPSADVLRVQLHAEGPTAKQFLSQPGKIFIFVDSKLVGTCDARKGTAAIDVPLPRHGDHVVAVNWRSDYGPVAVAVAPIRRPETEAAPGGGRP